MFALVKPVYIAINYSIIKERNYSSSSRQKEKLLDDLITHTLILFKCFFFFIYLINFEDSVSEEAVSAVSKHINLLKVAAPGLNMGAGFDGPSTDLCQSPEPRAQSPEPRAPSLVSS